MKDKGSSFAWNEAIQKMNDQRRSEAEGGDVDEDNLYAWLVEKLTLNCKCLKCGEAMESLRTEAERGDPIVFMECRNPTCGFRMYIQVGSIGRYK